MIYLNQAATTWPKPGRVLEAHARALAGMPEGQFRGGSFGGSENIADRCRKKLGELFSISDTDRIYFSSGATDSANAVIYGLDLGQKNVLATIAEHNSILRPLMNLTEQVGSVTMVPGGKWGKVTGSDLEARIGENTRAVFVNHCSNVTGVVQDLKELGMTARKHGLLFIVDASQSAGCIPLDVDGWGIDVLIFTGHKSLFGVQGTGGYYVRRGVPFRPYRYGGTGRNSRQLIYQGDYEYEPGTQNMPGIAALYEGVTYILERGIENIQREEQEKMGWLYRELEEIPGVLLYGAPRETLGPVLSFNIEGLDASDTAYILQNSYGITVRTGLHCAPLIHELLGTKEKGTVRVSISDLTAMDELKQFVQAVKEIVESTGHIK